MRLHEYIRDHTEEILVEWEAFARTVASAESMNIAALRDHARAMLMVIARDLATLQSSGQQSAKAAGKSDADILGAPSTAAQEHGADRAGSGFSIAEMLSELRALRASVIRLWTKQHPQLAESDLDDMTRFNEAIDQAVAESVSQYSGSIGTAKDRFLAILGHDLRNPLGAIMTSAQFLLEEGGLAETNRTLVARMDISARRMNQMVSDLLDFTRTTLGGDDIPVERKAMDVAQMVRDVASEVVARYPTQVVTVETHGDLHGRWDSDRLAQALTNLVGNAVQHGAKDGPIGLVARGSADEVEISVRNAGRVIPVKNLKHIFEPGVRLDAERRQDDGHLGLGLFIVDRIVAAHGGSIDVRSSKTEGTVFTIHLRRHAGPAPVSRPEPREPASRRS